MSWTIYTQPKAPADPPANLPQLKKLAKPFKHHVNVKYTQTQKDNEDASQLQHSKVQGLRNKPLAAQDEQLYKRLGKLPKRYEERRNRFTDPPMPNYHNVNTFPPISNEKVFSNMARASPSKQRQKFVIENHVPPPREKKRRVDAEIETRIMRERDQRYIERRRQPPSTFQFTGVLEKREPKPIPEEWSKTSRAKQSRLERQRVEDERMARDAEDYDRQRLLLETDPSNHNNDTNTNTNINNPSSNNHNKSGSSSSSSSLLLSSSCSKNLNSSFSSVNNTHKQPKSTEKQQQETQDGDAIDNEDMTTQSLNPEIETESQTKTKTNTETKTKTETETETSDEGREGRKGSQFDDNPDEIDTVVDESETVHDNNPVDNVTSMFHGDIQGDDDDDDVEEAYE